MTKKTLVNKDKEHSSGNILCDDILYSALASGIRRGEKNHNVLDLALIILPKNSITAAVFTKNIFCAAPVIVAKNHLPNDIRALIINSGNANAGTGIDKGSQGMINTQRICQLLSNELNIKAEQVLPFSTGVIGEQLPMSCFENCLKTLSKNATSTQIKQVAQAIMTTDTRTKIATRRIAFGTKCVKICAFAKGSGMIRPDMATMLSFISSDVCAENRTQLQTYLDVAISQSFNRITVDGDTSTNDAVTLSATGKSGVILAEIADEFSKALNEICLELAHLIIADGEGATKFVEIAVSGENSSDCLKVAYTVAHSPLVKTALFASDANIGRLLMAVGRAKVKNLKAQNIFIDINKVRIITKGVVDKNYSEHLGGQAMRANKIFIQIKIGENSTTERIWTTDLSYDYVRINAKYRS